MTDDIKPVNRPQRPAAIGFWRQMVALGIVVSLGLAGCGGASKTTEAPAPAESPAEVPPATEAPTAAVPTAPNSATQPEPAVSPAPVPTTAPAPAAPAPPTAPSTSGTALPDTLVKQWQPLSNVLTSFGPMTVTPTEVQWGNGQSSPYTVVSTDGGYLLSLAADPKLYDTVTPFIKLMPKTDDTGATTSMDVAFFDSEAKMQSNDYIMYGSYFVE